MVAQLVVVTRSETLRIIAVDETVTVVVDAIAALIRSATATAQDRRYGSRGRNRQLTDDVRHQRVDAVTDSVRVVGRHAPALVVEFIESRDELVFGFL